MGRKLYPFIGDLAEYFNRLTFKNPPLCFALNLLTQTEHLKTAGIGQNGFVPTHELLDAAKFCNRFFTGTEVKMICIGENNLRACAFKIVWRKRFYGGLRANRHKDWGLDNAMRCIHLPCSCLVFLSVECE